MGHALSPTLFRRQGSIAALKSTMAVPTLFHMAPSEPGPHAHAFLDAFSLPATPVSSLWGFDASLQKTDCLFALWPFASPLVSHSNSPVEMQVQKAAAQEVKMMVPPFMLSASTLLVATAQQLARTMASAASVWETAALASQAAHASREHSRASLSDSLLVGTGGYLKALPPIAKVSVCAQSPCLLVSLGVRLVKVQVDTCVGTLAKKHLLQQHIFQALSIGAGGLASDLLRVHAHSSEWSPGQCKSFLCSPRHLRRPSSATLEIAYAAAHIAAGGQLHAC